MACYEVTEVYSAMVPLLWFAKLFGLYHLTLRKTGTAKHFQVSIISVTFNILLIVFIIVTVYEASSEIFRSTASKHTTIFQTAFIMLGIIYVISTLVIRFFNMTKLKKTVDIFETLLKIHQDVKQDPNYYKNLFVLSSFRCIWNLIFILLASTCIVLSSDNTRHTIIGNITYVVSCSTVSITFSQAYQLYSIIHNRFKVLNEKISNAFIPAVENELESKTYSFTIKELTIGHPALDKQAKQAERTDSINKVYNLSKFYDQICDFTKSVSDIYSIGLLTAFVAMFCEITVISYVLCLRFFNIHNIVKKDILADIVYTLWGCHYMASIYSIVSVGNAVEVEANRVAEGVHKLINNTSDREVYLELIPFSLKLEHRRVHITVCGFFRLNNTLLFSIIGAMTTYLVIMIQFQLSNLRYENLEDSTQSP